MNEPRSISSASRSRLSRVDLHRLTTRGFSVEFAYRRLLAELDVDFELSKDARQGFEAAQAHWGTVHGLDSSRGALLVQLREGQQTLPDIEQLLRSSSYAPVSIRADLRLLMSAGLVEGVRSDTAARARPSFDMVEAELSSALAALEVCRRQCARHRALRDQGAHLGLLRALSRSIAARNFLATFEGPFRGPHSAPRLDA